MTAELKKFIENSIELINDADSYNDPKLWIELFNLFYDEVYNHRYLDYDDVNILLNILQSADIGSNLDIYLIAKGTLISHDAHMFEDAGSMHGLNCDTEWSRFTYLFDNHVDSDISAYELINWMQEFQKELKLNIRKLQSDNYTYDRELLNGDEYDLGWFDEADFDEVYSEL